MPRWAPSWLLSSGKSDGSNRGVIGPYNFSCSSSCSTNVSSNFYAQIYGAYFYLITPCYFFYYFYITPPLLNTFPKFCFIFHSLLRLKLLPAFIKIYFLVSFKFTIYVARIKLHISMTYNFLSRFFGYFLP